MLDDPAGGGVSYGCQSGILRGSQSVPATAERTGKLTLSSDGPIEQVRSTFSGLYTPRRLAVVLAVSLAMFALLVNTSWRIGPDSALYVGLGRSLADGRGFTFNDEPHTLVLPGYPALLAALQWCFGEGFLALRAAHALMGWLCGILVFLTLRRLYGDNLAFAVFMLFGVSYSLFQRSAYFLSDVPFTLVTWLALWLSVRAGTSARHRWPWALGAAAALAACSLVRINGAGVVPAVLVFLAVRWRGEGSRAWLRLLVVALAFLAPAAWLVLNEAAAPSGDATYVRAAFTSRSIGYFAKVYLDGLLGYPRAIGEAVIGVPDVRWGGEVLVLVPIAVGWWACLRRRHWLLPLLVLVQLAGLCLSTPGDRYLIPLLPALVLFALVGLAAVFGWLDRRRGWFPAPRARRVILIVFVVLLAGQLGRDIFKAIPQARTAVPGGAEPARKQYLFVACRWISDHAMSDTPRPVILTNEVTVVHVLTGARVLFSETVAAAGELPERPDYVLLPAEPKYWTGVRDAIDRAGGRLEPVALPEGARPLELFRIVWPTAAMARAPGGFCN